MWSWRTIPFVLLSLSLAIGIVGQQILNYYHFVMPWFLGLLTLGVLLLLDKSRLKSVFTISTLILFVGLGYSLSYYSNPQHHSDYFHTYIQEDEITAVMTISDHGKTKSGLSKLTCKLILCLHVDGTWMPCTGNLLVYIKNATCEYKYGQTLKMTTRVNPIQGPKNPYSFDYKKYMERKYVFDQTFIEADQIQELPIFSGNHLIRFSKNIQAHCLSILDQHLDGDAQKGVAAALLLGEKSVLPDDIKEDYTATGATHVLAVSGLHTGIVAGSLLLLLQFIRRNTIWIRLGKCTIALSALWLFVLVTGMAPSVLRAATMFTFILIGQLLVKRPTNIYNIIALSAFILMMIDPIIIYQVGFQLSYSALIGIVAFQQKIYRSVYISSKFLKPIWSLMTVSIAAQLGTLPFTLYYFHMFPFYFWLSGIIVVPMAGVLLKLGMITMVTSAVLPGITFIPAKMLSAATWLMNRSIQLCADLPMIESDGLWIHWYEAILLALCLLLLGFGWNLYRKELLKLALIVTLVLTASITYGEWTQSRQQVFTVYDIKNHTIIDYFDGTNCTCFTDADIDASAFQYATRQNRWAHGIDHCELVYLPDIMSSNVSPSNQKTIKLSNDLIIQLSENTSDGSIQIYLSALPETYVSNIQIIDGSFKNGYYVDRDSLMTDSHWYTSIDGAFQTTFK